MIPGATRVPSACPSRVAGPAGVGAAARHIHTEIANDGQQLTRLVWRNQPESDYYRGGAGPVGQPLPDTLPLPSGLPRADFLTLAVGRWFLWHPYQSMSVRSLGCLSI